MASPSTMVSWGHLFTFSNVINFHMVPMGLLTYGSFPRSRSQACDPDQDTQWKSEDCGSSLNDSDFRKGACSPVVKVYLQKQNYRGLVGNSDDAFPLRLFNPMNILFACGVEITLREVFCHLQTEIVTRKYSLPCKLLLMPQRPSSECSRSLQQSPATSMWKVLPSLQTENGMRSPKAVSPWPEARWDLSVCHWTCLTLLMKLLLSIVFYSVLRLFLFIFILLLHCSPLIELSLLNFVCFLFQLASVILNFNGTVSATWLSVQHNIIREPK